MQRDLHLFRTILLAVEAQSTPDEPTIHALAVEGVDQGFVNEHVKLLIDAGYLEGTYKYTANERIMFTLVRGLSHKGHEFLDNVRHEAIWQTTMERVRTTTGTASLEAVEQLVQALVASMLGRPRQA